MNADVRAVYEEVTFIMSYYDAVYPEYGFGRHKGYGTKRHFGALREFGPSPIHRRTFTLVK